MRRIAKFLILPLAVFSMFTSCIQDEAPNAEADILTCEIADDILVSEPVIDNYSVTLRIESGADISKLAPVFTITAGATISPASGSAHDFLNAENHTVYYTVTSQDGKWSKRYPVRVVQKEVPSEYKMNANHLDPTGKYTIFVENDEEGEAVMTWASGNPGYVMCGVADKVARDEYGEASYKNHVWEFFPTAPVYASAVDFVEKDQSLHFSQGGNSSVQPDYIRLETSSTGSFGKMVGMPIAAGNIFQGFFDLSMAIKDPRGATKFGEPYRYKPLSFTGRYRYKAGAVFTDENGNTVAGKKDTFSIYALFYDTEVGNSKIEYIDGSIHDSNFKHPHLVAIAMVPDTGETSEWKTFDIPFVLEDGKTIDADRLAQGKYKLGIVVSSSLDGDRFKGAVGSTLDICDLKIVHE